MSDVLVADTRTMWAYRTYMEQRAPRGISEQTARLVLSLLEPGDLVELFADVVIPETRRMTLRITELKRTDRVPTLAVRTLRSWILVDLETGQPTVVPGRASGVSVFTNRATEWPDIGLGLRLIDPAGNPAGWTAGRDADIGVKFFFDSDSSYGPQRQVIERGAGNMIKRLPESPLVPPMPDLESLPLAAPTPPPPAPVALPSDWRTAEEIACVHLQSLGFTDATLTAGGRDGGVDVIARDAAAQVKMQALPVGAPQVQQLRGSRPHLAHHVFYSSSGYTAAALQVAADIGVHLFKIEPTGAVTPVSASAATLGRAEPNPSEPQQATAEQVVRQYVAEVRKRVAQATAGDLGSEYEQEKYDGQHSRLSRYLHTGLENLKSPPEFPTPRAEAVYYHHSELLVALFFQEFGIPYPEGARPAPPPPTLEDYY